MMRFCAGLFLLIPLGCLHTHPLCKESGCPHCARPGVAVPLAPPVDPVVPGQLRPDNAHAAAQALLDELDWYWHRAEMPRK